MKRWRLAHPDRVRENKRRWKRTEKGKRATAKYQPSPLKQQARNAVNYAVIVGTLVRGPCAHNGPGCRGKVQAHHHRGYAKRHWLTVTWLCAKHHDAEHQER